MSQEPVVSVIIIFLNTEKYLEEAIASVLAQTFNGWELLLCDDGSTDGGTRIAKECAQRYPDRVRYLEHDGHLNHGMSATRNLGLKHARGEFISWLDADDVWQKNKLQRQVQLIGENPTAAMVYGPLRIWYSWNGKSSSRHRDFTQNVGFPPNTLIPAPKLLCTFLRDDMHIPSGILIRKRVLEEVGGYEHSFRDEFEDVIVHSKVCLKYPAFVAGEWWYKYRQHDDSCCAETRRTGRERSRRLAFFNRLEQYMREHGYEGGEAWQVLQELMAPYRKRMRFWMSETSRRIASSGKRAVTQVLPPNWLGAIRRLRHARKETPPVGCVRFGGLRSLKPVSQAFGWDRGLPVDRHYIETFLSQNAPDIRGRVLEVGDRFYTETFGRDVKISDVLHAKHGNPEATLVGDLCSGQGIPQDTFDCMILTQVFPFLYDFKAGIAHAARALKPGGVMLATFAGISQISRYDVERWGDFWRFTSISAKRLFEDHFPPQNLTIQTYGNVLAATAFLQGIAAEELEPHELDHHDPDFEMIITVRAVRQNNGAIA